MQFLIFSIGSLFRLFSGFGNSGYYFNNKELILGSTILMLILLVFTGFLFTFPASLLLAIPGIVLLLMLFKVLLRDPIAGKESVIHTYENVLQWSFMLVLGLLGADIYQILLSSFAGNALFNQVIYYYKAVKYEGKSSTEGIFALWDSPKADIKKYEKNNFFRFNFMTGKFKIILGFLALATSVVLWQADIKLSVDLLQYLY